MSNLLSLEVSARTHVGAKRTENEDRLLVTDFAGGGSLLAVCDGMGGEAGGEVASTLAVSTLEREAQAFRGDTATGVARGVLEAVHVASSEIEALANARLDLSRMGTTATVCAISDESLIVAQVGDSRAYLLRGERLVQLTRDQTLATLLLERGQLTPDQLDTFEYNHVILQALGHKGGVDVDLGWLRLAGGDTLLLCSDGLHGCVDDSAIEATLRDKAPSEACDALIRLALAGGAPDNVTCIVARVHGGLSEPTDPTPKLEKVVLPVQPLESRSSEPEVEPPPSSSTFSRLRSFLLAR